MDKVIAAFNEAATGLTDSSKALAGTAETLVHEQQAARDRERARDARDRRRFGIVYVVFLVLALALGWLLWLRYQDETTRAERSTLAEAQRRCSDTLIADDLVRVSIFATRSGTDPRQIDDLQALIARSHDDPSALAAVRDKAEAILRSIPQANSQLRADVQKANERLLRMRDICYSGTPPADPLAN